MVHLLLVAQSVWESCVVRDEMRAMRCELGSWGLGGWDGEGS